MYIFLIHSPTPSFIFLIKQLRNLPPQTKIENITDNSRLPLCSPPSLAVSSHPLKGITILTLVQIAGLRSKYCPSSCTVLDPNGHAFLPLPHSITGYGDPRKGVTSGEVALCRQILKELTAGGWGASLSLKRSGRHICEFMATNNGGHHTSTTVLISSSPYKGVNAIIPILHMGEDAQRDQEICPSSFS